jgi:hypothetical protein
VAAEAEQRQKELMAKVGIEKLESYTTAIGGSWIRAYTTEEYVKSM